LVLLDKKVEMLYTLRPFTYAIEEAGNLSGAEVSELNDRLMQLGFEDIVIELDNAPGDFGELIHFKVAALYAIGWFESVFTKIRREVDYGYEREIYVRKVVN
jgi:hypothetical protein